MAYLIRNDIYLKTTRIIEGTESLGNAEMEYKRWLESHYDFQICNIVLDCPILNSEFASENYVIYIITKEPRKRCKQIHEMMDENYREWIIGFINIGLKYHLHVLKPIEIRLFDFYQEVYYDFQNIYNVHFDADEYYRTLNPNVVFFKCFRLCCPVVLFYTEEDKTRYTQEGVLDRIQTQYEEFVKRYDTYGLVAGESVIFGTREQLMNEYGGDINRYFE